MLKAGAQRDVVARGVEVYLWCANSDGSISVVQDALVFGPHDERAVVEPLFFLGEREAIRLMDDLWNAGIRPSSTRAANETLAAKDAHIQDLRRIVFGRMDAEQGQRFAEFINEATPANGRDE
jgi:hypothetical protein